MIGLLSKVNIIDNSGGVEGRCIKILDPKSTPSGRKTGSASVGDLILISITKAMPTTTAASPKKGKIYKALIVRTKKASNTKLKANKNIEVKKKTTAKELSNNQLTQHSAAYNSGNIKYIPLKRAAGLLERKKEKSESIINKFSENSVVLVKLNVKTNKDYAPIGTRIRGPLCKSIKNRKGCIKIISIAT